MNSLVDLSSKELEESVGGLLIAIGVSYLVGFATGCAILYFANK